MEESGRTMLPLAFLLLLLLAPAHAEDLTPVLRYMHVNTEIQARFATTDLLSEIENRSPNATEVTYTAEIPENAFIRSFYLEQNGLIAHGVIKAKENAEQEYEAAKKDGKSAAHLRKTNNKNFELQVALAPFAKIGFNLTYQEVLQRKGYMYKHVVSVKSKLPVMNLEVNILLADKHNFSRIHVPKMAAGIAELPVEELLKMPQDERVLMQSSDDDSGAVAYISYDDRARIDAGELVVLYNTTAEAGQSDVQVVNGYFLHEYTPPDDLDAANKTVVFVLDRSGSMRGAKLAQMQEAMIEIIDEIGENDQINIVTFDNHVQSWNPKVQKLNAESKAAAKEFVNGIEAKGGTNIAAAIETALMMLAEAQKVEPSFMASVMVLTDGRATVGAKTHGDVLEHVYAVRSDQFPVNSISFGNDADYLLMTKLAAHHSTGGIARRIFENADATIQIAGFYHEIAYPLLKHLKIHYLDQSVDAASVITSGDDSFINAGEEFFQLGRLMDPTNVLSAEISTEAAKGLLIEKTEVAASSGCINGGLLPEDSAARGITLCGGADDPSIGGFIERMWVHLTIRKYERLLVAVTKTEEEKKNVAAQIRALSLKYGFVTSQTSMVVVLPGEEGASSLEEEAFDDEFLNSDSGDAAGAARLRSLDLSPRFRTPFIASKESYPSECRIHLIVLMDRALGRRLSGLKASKLVNDLSLLLRENVTTMTAGVISANRSIIIGGGNEDKLFSLVEANRGVRQHLLLLSDFSTPLARPLEYLQVLAPAFSRITVARLTGSFDSTQKAAFQSLGDVVFLKLPNAQKIVDLTTCS